ncbi:MAG: hypothetical protein L0H84_12385 [Pseudonocardia sp.]|nr:hypothetical protein [Pseudonocardia sp.]
MLATELLAGSPAVALPDHDTTQVEPATLTELPSIEFRADVVVVVLTAEQVPAAPRTTRIGLVERDAELAALGELVAGTPDGGSRLIVQGP